MEKIMSKLIRLNETMEEMTNLTLLLTGKCTLNCKLCATYTPYHRNPQHYSYEVLTKSVKRIFECVDTNIGIVSIGGGEPLMHPDLIQILKFLNQYEKRVEMFEIATNGTIIPSEAVLQELKNSPKMHILLDNYGEELSIHVKEIVEKLEEYEIPYRLRNYTKEDSWCGGWINVSDFTEKHRTEEQICETYKKCGFNTIYGNMYFLINGVAHICYMSNQILEFVDETDDESVDLLDDNMTNAEIHEKLLNLRDRKCLHACRNCNGFMLDSEHVLAAEQLPREK